MTSLLRRFVGPSSGERADLGLAFQQWVEIVKYGGLTYGAGGNQTLGNDQERIASSFQGYVDGAYKTNGIVFACILARMLLFSEARFQFQQMRQGRPGNLFGTPDLQILETPWQNGTTADLLARAEQDTSMAGNFYAARLNASTLTRMRPDWVTIVMGSLRRDWEPDDLDTEVVGYLYHPGGPLKGRDPVVLLPEQVVHFAPIPDPTAHYRGMSWITPVVQEVMGDKAMQDHKLRFFENGSTVNLVVKMDPSLKAEAFNRWVAMFKDAHQGRANAYETVFLGGGADMEAVGANMQQNDFKQVQGAGETRIAAAAGVPPIVVGLSEGLDSATYSNYAQARRRFADGTMRPLWRQMAGALAQIVQVPSGARLWYDDRDVPFLQEDVKDEADIQQTQSISIKQLVEAGFTPESVIAAIQANDFGLLSHTGLFSVQLAQPASGDPTQAPADTGANGRRMLAQFVQNN